MMTPSSSMSSYNSWWRMTTVVLSIISMSIMKSQIKVIDAFHLPSSSSLTTTTTFPTRIEMRRRRKNGAITRTTARYNCILSPSCRALQMTPPNNNENNDIVEPPTKTTTTTLSTIDPEPFGVSEKTMSLMQLMEEATADAEAAVAAAAAEEEKEEAAKLEIEMEEKEPIVIIEKEEVKETKEKKETAPPPPTLSFLSILQFVTPTLALWIAPPIMSLIDTSVVGRYCGSTDLAALGPGCTLVDSTSYLFMFLATATTNLVATAQAEHRQEDAERTIGESLCLSLCAGVLLSTLILSFGKTFISLIAGAESVNVVPSATKYALVRSIGQPASIFASVCRAAFLADKDTMGPLVSVSLAFMGNAVGTYVLVKYAQMGIVGAAIGTLVADVSAALFLFGRMKKMRLQRWKIRKQEKDDKDGGVAINTDSAETSPSPPPIIVIPTFANLKNFLQYAAPIFFTILGKSVVYNGVSLAVGRIGSLALAAHQVLLRSFFFWTPVGDSVGMTSQVFLPSILAQEKQTGVPKHGAKRVLFLSGVLAGGIAATLAGWLPTGGVQFFTDDVSVVQLLKRTAPILSYSVLMHAIALTCEGMLLAQKDLKFLSRSYVVTTIVTAAVLLSPLRPASLGAAWWILALFQGGRALQFSLRTAWLSRRRILVGKKERDEGGEEVAFA